MRECRQPLFRLADPDLMKKFQHPGTRAIAFQTLMQCQDLANLSLDRVQRIERGHRLLEDHGDVVAAHRAELWLAGGHQVTTVEKDLAGGVAGGGIRQEFEDRRG